MNVDKYKTTLALNPEQLDTICQALNFLLNYYQGRVRSWEEIAAESLDIEYQEIATHQALRKKAEIEKIERVKEKIFSE